MRATMMGALLLAGCGGGGSFADVGGSIRETNFDNVEVVYHGGPFLLFFDTAVDCIDLPWVAKTYDEGPAVAENLDFVAIQFAADDDSFPTGTTSVAGDSLVAAFGLINNGETLEVERGREGTITLDVVEPDRLEGTFEVAWADSTTVRSTAFRSEYCVNIDP